MFIDELNMIWQCQLTAQEASYIPGCIKKKCGQQVKEGNSTAQLRSCETSPGLLCPPLRPSTSEKHGHAKDSPEESYKYDPRAGVYVCTERFRELEWFNLEKRRIHQTLEQFSRIQRGPKRNLEREFLQAYEVTGQVEWL